MELLDNTFRRLYFMYDDFYRHRHRLEAVGPMLLIREDEYDGEPRAFDDGTVLNPGQPLGILHFDNKFLLMNTAAAGRRAGLFFREQLFCSLKELALASDTGKYRHIHAYTGVTWLASHGERVGFRTEPLPQTLRSRLLAFHFGILLHAFYGRGKAGKRTRQQPRRFWLTRKQLFENFLR